MKEIEIWKSLHKEMKYCTYADFTRIEAWNIHGVPDINGCYRGKELWIESKRCDLKGMVEFRPLQIPWMDRRRRSGGQVFLAVVTPSEELLFFDAALCLDIDEHGIFHVRHKLKCQKPWSWAMILDELTRAPLGVPGA